ncbi:hypothetical protein ACIHCM_37245 [Streptomyces sp. NPDC052023]|uniref:hypothetical protein n=1 Tax=Streptomyces sp. NPDC052023 TaxID=3365681 RepID=UPI0037D25D35
MQYARDWRGSNEDRLFHVARVGGQREDQDRADLGPGRGAQLKAEADHDLTDDGPNLAAQAIAAGQVDEKRALDSGLIYARYRIR